MKPLGVDLFCGLGGFTDGLLAEQYEPIGFDIERHVYGEHRYPAQLVIQDILTLHGSQLKDARLIVASPPCQKYSYMAMPWGRSKALARWYRDPAYPERLTELNALFNACFRIQREASKAAGRHIPMVVENVRGAQPWVGRSRWNFGSFYLWGDVPALMPQTFKAQKFNPDGTAHPPGSWFAIADSLERGAKSSGMNWSDPTKRGQDFTRVAGRQRTDGVKGVPHRTAGHWTNPSEHEGVKVSGGASGWFGENNSPMRQGSSGSTTRKAASAMIAKIPLPLARHIAKVYRTA